MTSQPNRRFGANLAKVARGRTESTARRRFILESSDSESSDDFVIRRKRRNISNSKKNISECNEENIHPNLARKEKTRLSLRESAPLKLAKRSNSIEHKPKPHRPPNQPRPRPTKKPLVLQTPRQNKHRPVDAQSSRQKQTRMTDFMRSRSDGQNTSNLPTRSILQGTAFEGINLDVRNEYDRMSARDIRRLIQEKTELLGNKSMISILPDGGKRIKDQLAQLDEALMRVEARNLVAAKRPAPQPRPYVHPQPNVQRKTKLILSHSKSGPKSHVGIRSAGVGSRRETWKGGSGKNLDENDLEDLLNSIQQLSINPLDGAHKALNSQEKLVDEYLPVPETIKIELYPHQRVGYTWMVRRETHEFAGQPFGGIVADEMGLGKTMQIIALMMSDHEVISSLSVDSKLFRTEATLVVCPVSVMSHWESEIRKFVQRGACIVHRYHGNNRVREPRRLSSAFNVVLTTYGSIQSEYQSYSKKRTQFRSVLQDSGVQSAPPQKPPLFAIEWKRIVLDEAHTIKNRQSKTHKSICQLAGRAKWFMTATPVQNVLDDLYAAFHFLKYNPYNEYSRWKSEIVENPRGMSRIKTLLSSIMLRRRKNDEVECPPESEQKERDEKPIRKKLVELPARNIVIHTIQFNDFERDVYTNMASTFGRMFRELNESQSVGKNFQNCLSMLLRLRQACNSLELISNIVYAFIEFQNGKQKSYSRIRRESRNERDSSPVIEFDELMSMLRGDDRSNDRSPQFVCSNEYLQRVSIAIRNQEDECTICLDSIENLTITSCGHRFCTECIMEMYDTWLETEAKRKAKLERARNRGFTLMNDKEIPFECPNCRFNLTRADLKRVVQSKEKIAPRRVEDDRLQYSSKIEKLCSLLSELRRDHPHDKCVIFSQWTTMLDLVAKRLTHEYPSSIVRLDGKMPPAKREESIHRFNEDDSAWIFLISLKAGGVGLNLTRANHVFMMDIWWNPAIEDQAFDRVHRIGQTKDVTVHRIVVENTVEKRVLALQEKKRSLASTTIDGFGKSSKVSQNLRVGDLMELFS